MSKLLDVEKITLAVRKITLEDTIQTCSEDNDSANSPKVLDVNLLKLDTIFLFSC